jgi:tRNASer (uridine44-2'-O)-methyltransferase
MWPENTDPLKFVYEDVAIAAYLLLLWEQERLQRRTPDAYQTFIDLGCGNGLLVHILTSEGHQGVGLDVRKRKIWDFYPSSTKLQVDLSSSSAKQLFLSHSLQ